jgi:hypothetical protein
VERQVRYDRAFPPARTPTDRAAAAS